MAFNQKSIEHEASHESGIQLDQAMSVLTDIEKVVIKKYYTDDKTFKEIGKELDTPLSESPGFPHL